MITAAYTDGFDTGGKAPPYSTSKLSWSSRMPFCGIRIETTLIAVGVPPTVGSVRAYGIRP